MIFCEQLAVISAIMSHQDVFFAKKTKIGQDNNRFFKLVAIVRVFFSYLWRVITQTDERRLGRNHPKTSLGVSIEPKHLKLGPI